MDMQKVLDGGPWSFEQSMLVYHRLMDNEDPQLVNLLEVDMWVQIYDIPKGSISENVLKNIGDSFVRYVKSDPANFHNTWKDHVRVRVTLNVDKPIKRRMKLKRDGTNWNWINFKYERLPSFCFVCGIIGHSDRDCSVVYANPEKIVERAYGVWLRAPTRNTKTGVGARWLRNTNTGENQWEAHTAYSGTTTTNQDGEKTEARFMEVDGTFREISGNDDVVKIVTRNQGNSENLNLLQNQGDMTGNNNLNLKETIVLDPKRRRVEPDLQGEVVGQDNVYADGLEIGNGPKNVNVAGSGLQARQTL